MIFRLLLLFSIFAVMVGCGTKNPATHPTAEQYFQEGEDYFENGHYENAISSWEKVRDSYYSPELNTLAEFKIAETYYLSERYPEAATAFADFVRQHPTDSRLETAVYRLGLSHFNQMLSADRDQTDTESALQVFQDYRKRYPEGPHLAETMELIQQCRERLAEHEVYVGWFYLHEKHYLASINRLERALANYPKFSNRDEALFYLCQGYAMTGDKEKAKEYFNTLSHQYPGSKFIDKAQAILTRND